MNMIANDNRLRRQEIMLRLLNYETLSYQKTFGSIFLSRVAACPMTSTSLNIFFQKDGASLSFNNSGTFFSGSEISGSADFEAAHD